MCALARWARAHHFRGVLLSHERENNRRGVRWVMVHGLVGGDECRRGGERLPTAQVTGEARVRAAGHLQPESMPALEVVGCRPEIDLDL